MVHEINVNFRERKLIHIIFFYCHAVMLAEISKVFPIESARSFQFIDLPFQQIKYIDNKKLNILPGDRRRNIVFSKKRTMRKTCPILFIIIFLFSCSKNNSHTEVKSIKLGRIYYGINGTMSCFDLQTMSKIWETPGVFAYSNVPFYDSGIVFTSNMYGASAIDAENGSVKWKLNYSSQLYANNSMLYDCSPIVKDSLLYTLGFTGISGYANAYCINKTTGKLVWQSLIAGGGSFINYLSNPIILGDKLIVVGRNWDRQNKIMCFNRINGQIVWQVDIMQQGIIPSDFPATDGNLIFINDVKQNQLHAFDINNGEKKWTTSLPVKLDINGRLRVRGKNIYALSEYDDLNQKGYLYLIATETGNLKHTISYPKYYASFSVDDNGVFATNYFRTANFDLESLERIWYLENHKTDSLSNFHFYLASELISTESYLLTHYTGEANSACQTGFTLINKTTGEIIWDSATKNCDIYRTEKCVYVLDKKRYYPSIGGL
jgi:outer membrane protein assembly factor BamB